MHGEVSWPIDYLQFKKEIITSTGIKKTKIGGEVVI